MARIWGILRIKEKIAQDLVVELEEADLDESLEALCMKLDIPRPVVLRKHREEFARFFRTRFSKDDFIESVHFAYFEVELLRERKNKNNTEHQWVR
jgi:hypothetical protein